MREMPNPIFERDAKARRPSTRASERTSMCLSNVRGLVIYFALMLGVSPACQAVEPPYSFDKAPFVHPKIIEDLSTLVSDRGEQVVGINLDESENTSRYFGDIQVNGKVQPFVFYEDA